MTGLIFVGITMLSNWDTNRRRRIFVEELSSQLGISVDEFESPEVEPRLVELLSKRYSSDLFVNRFSDFAYIPIIVVGWVGGLVQLGILIAAAWSIYFGTRSDAIISWVVPALLIFFTIAAVVYDFVCRLLTGRSAGEAKKHRKLVTDFYKRQAERQLPHV